MRAKARRRAEKKVLPGKPGQRDRKKRKQAGPGRGRASVSAFCFRFFLISAAGPVFRRFFPAAFLPAFPYRFTISITPDTASITITRIFTGVSGIFLAASMPSPIPASMKGSRHAACLRAAQVKMPVTA